MKRPYTEKELKQIMKQDVVIPETVNDKIKQAYQNVGLEEKTTMRRYKKHRMFVALAASITLFAATSLVVLAASRYFSVELIEKEKKLEYQLEVNKELEAHEIVVTPTFMPQGYELGDENSVYGGKWHNNETGGGISIIPYNAAELEKVMSDGAFKKFKSDDHMETIAINDMNVDVFLEKGMYEDSQQIQEIYLFNEEYGYAVQIWHDGGLPIEDLKKVAEGLDIKVLDSTVKYQSEAEKKAESANNDSWVNAEKRRLKEGVPKEKIYEIGEVIKNPAIQEWDNYPQDMAQYHYTVLDVEVRDTLPLSEFPKEYFPDYDNEVAPWLNEDGSLKPHERYSYLNEGDEPTLETVNSKYVVVKLKVKNVSDPSKGIDPDIEVDIAPELTQLVPKEDGSFDYQEMQHRSANEGYGLQWGGGNGGSMAIYFDKPYYLEGVKRLKSFLIRPIAMGEEIEYTVAYVVDEDQLDHTYLRFFTYYGFADSKGNNTISPYVGISK